MIGTNQPTYPTHSEKRTRPRVPPCNWSTCVPSISPPGCVCSRICTLGAPGEVAEAPYQEARPGNKGRAALLKRGPPRVPSAPPPLPQGSSLYLAQLTRPPSSQLPPPQNTSPDNANSSILLVPTCVLLKVNRGVTGAGCLCLSSWSRQTGEGWGRDLAPVGNQGDKTNCIGKAAAHQGPT